MASTPTRWHLGADDGVRRFGRRALVVGAASAALCALGATVDTIQFLRSYLFAYLFFAGAALGSLAVLMLQHVTGGAWGAAVRRLLESGARTLPLMALLFVPVALGTGDLYEWAGPDAATDALLVRKSPYLNVPFFLGRTVFYFVAWITVTHYLVRWSHEQDTASDDRYADRLERLSRGGLVLLGLTLTFASIDWAMSLEPHWFSTMYGILFMGGSVLTALAMVIAFAATLADHGVLSDVLNAGHFHDLGKLLLAFVMLWAYFAFSQFLIVWAGNLPEEIPWYLARLEGGWQWLALGLFVFHFALPFALLLSRDIKRKASTLATVAIALLGFRLLDTFWMVAPAFDPARFSVHWLDVVTVLAVGGLWLAMFVRRLGDGPVIPLGDPQLEIPTR